jgi:hypothetical protein
MRDPLQSLREQETITTERIAVVAVLIILVAPTVAPVVAAAVNTVFVSSGVPVQTNSGLTITVGQSGQFNLRSPFVAPDAVELKNVTFSGNNSEATVDNFGDPATGGTETRLSNMDVTGGQLTVNRTATSPNIGVSGTVTALNVSATDLQQNSGTIDIDATATGTWNLEIENTGLAAGTGVVAEVPATGSALASGSVEPDGDVQIEGLPAVADAQIDLHVGASELKVFRESEPSQPVDNATLRIRLFSNGNVIEREVQNGEVDLTGVPTDSRVTITALNTDDSNATGLVYRRITIPSVTQQAEIYLLNASRSTPASVDFRVDDRTGGEFPPGGTRFLIEKPIRKDFDNDGQNETRFQVVSGDSLGNSREFPAILERNERYRLRVINADGDVRQLGSYTVRGPANPTIEIGRISLATEDETRGYAADVQKQSEDVDGDGTDEQLVQVQFQDVNDQTRNLDYEVVNTDTNKTEVSETISGPLGTHSNTVVVDNQTDQGDSYRLDWSAERETENGTFEQIEAERYAGGLPPIADRLPIDNRWLELISFVSIIAIAGLIVIIDSAVAAAVTTGWASLLSLLGFVAIPAPALGLAGVVSLTAIVGRVR